MFHKPLTLFWVHGNRFKSRLVVFAEAKILDVTVIHYRCNVGHFAAVAASRRRLVSLKFLFRARLFRKPDQRLESLSKQIPRCLDERR